MKQKVMINNGSSYSMNDIYEYLAGYTTKLNGKIQINKEKGIYYDTIVVLDK